MVNFVSILSSVFFHFYFIFTYTTFMQMQMRHFCWSITPQNVLSNWNLWAMHSHIFRDRIGVGGKVSRSLNSQIWYTIWAMNTEIRDFINFNGSPSVLQNNVYIKLCLLLPTVLYLKLNFPNFSEVTVKL